MAADLDRSEARAAAAASIAVRRSFSCANPALISLRNWCIGEPSRVGSMQPGELGRVAVEVGPEELADAADGAVALRLVEQVVDERTQLAAIAEELLQGARQAPVAVGEVGPERLFEGQRGRSLVAWLCCSSASNSRRTTSTLTVTPASWSAMRPILRARSTRAGRSSIGRSAT